MKYTFTPKLNKKNMVQSFALQTLVPIYNITFFDRKESQELLNYWQFSHLHSFIFPYRECSLISMTSQERVTAYAFTLAKIRKKLSERNSIRTKIVTLDLSPTNSRCSNNVGLFAVSRTFLAHSVMYGQKKVKAGDIIYKGIYPRSTSPKTGASLKLPT